MSAESVSADRSTLWGYGEPSTQRYHGRSSFSLAASGSGAGIYQDYSNLPHLPPYNEQGQYPSEPVRQPSPRFDYSPLPPEGIEHTPHSYHTEPLHPVLPEGDPSDDEEERIQRSFHYRQPTPPNRPGKRKDREEEEDEDFRPRKVVRKTQIACDFCRGELSLSKKY